MSDKPLSMAIEEFKNTLYSICQNSVVPTYIMEPIVKNLHDDVAMVAKRVTDDERNKYLSENEKGENV